jgi:hypothetical protein
MKISYITENKCRSGSYENLFDSELMTPTLPSSMSPVKYINAATKEVEAPPRKRQLSV